MICELDRGGAILRATIALAGIVLICLPAAGQAAQVRMALHLTESQISWGEPDLKHKLLDRLSARDGLEVTLINDSAWATSASGNSFFDAEFVARSGSEADVRYVLSLTDVRTDLAVRKGLSIPLLLSRYSVVGTVSGVMRIVDTHKGRVIYDETFEIDKRGPSHWQPLDDDRNSSKLHFPAAEKPRFLESLEWRTADRLAKIILRKIKLR
ncbi:MAG: hypothetical protein IH914_06035 [candidate division Zixibacteria bacterium]|nr:hypothetical protein [candidate division Zixibacteria bacterium]